MKAEEINGLLRHAVGDGDGDAPRMEVKPQNIIICRRRRHHGRRRRAAGRCPPHACWDRAGSGLGRRLRRPRRRMVRDREGGEGGTFVLRRSSKANKSPCRCRTRAVCPSVRLPAIKGRDHEWTREGGAKAASGHPQLSLDLLGISASHAPFR